MITSFYCLDLALRLVPNACVVTRWGSSSGSSFSVWIAPRTIISHVVLTRYSDFKSYKGHHVLLFGDAYFTSIIGPNGSGKSNSSVPPEYTELDGKWAALTILQDGCDLFRSGYKIVSPPIDQPARSCLPRARSTNSQARRRRERNRTNQRRPCGERSRWGRITGTECIAGPKWSKRPKICLGYGGLRG